MSVYIEWIDMPGGSRLVEDGPFAFVTVTYDMIRAQRPGGDDEDLWLGTVYEEGDGTGVSGFIREGDESEGRPHPDAEPIKGWYSDISIFHKEAP